MMRAIGTHALDPLLRSLLTCKQLTPTSYNPTSFNPTSSLFSSSIKIDKEVWSLVLDQQTQIKQQLETLGNDNKEMRKQIGDLIPENQRLNTQLLDQSQLLAERRALLKECLEDKGVKELRGAAEVMAAHSMVKGGTASFFRAVANNKNFLAFVERSSVELAATKRFLFRTDDVERCVQDMYHTLSCGQHGTPQGTMTVTMGHKLDDNNVAAICLVAEYFGFPYILLDRNGNLVIDGFRIKAWTAKPLSTFVQ